MNKLLTLNGNQNLQSVKATVGSLYNYHVELEANKNSILNILLKDKIKSFYNANGLKLNGVFRDIETLQKEYCVFENNQLKVIDNKPVLLPEKSEDELNKKWEELMQKEIFIVV